MSYSGRSDWRNNMACYSCFNGMAVDTPAGSNRIGEKEISV